MQWVSLTGKDDNVSDDNQSSSVDHDAEQPGKGIASTTTSSCSKNLNVTTTDNDIVGLVISKDNVTVDEHRGTDNFTVRLQSEPQDNVTLTVTDNDSTEVSLSQSH